MTKYVSSSQQDHVGSTVRFSDSDSFIRECYAGNRKFIVLIQWAMGKVRLGSIDPITVGLASLHTDNACFDRFHRLLHLGESVMCVWFEFSSVQDYFFLSFFSLSQKGPYAPHPSLSFPNIAIETAPSDWRWPSVVLSRKMSSISSSHDSLIQAIDVVMSLALCPQANAPQHWTGSLNLWGWGQVWSDCHLLWLRCLVVDMANILYERLRLLNNNNNT